ncbi:MAG TPA: VTT domain-containing protein [Opitutaceae bacterium]|nr:VTT domain-containing protein [Opitutaceae bacterium]
MPYSPKPLVSPAALAIAVLGAAAVLGLGFWAYEVNHDAVLGLFQETALWMRRLPWPVFYLTVALLPFAFCPISLLYLSAGAVHGFWLSFAGIMVAMAVNITLSYWLAAGPLHGLIARWFARRGRAIPVLPESEHIWAVLAVRFTPAFPLIVQNYLLGLAHVPFRKYFWVSLAAEAVIAFGYILAGDALTEDHPGYVLAAFGCVVGAVVLARLLRGMFAKKVHPLDEQRDAPAEDNKKGEP